MLPKKTLLLTLSGILLLLILAASACQTAPTSPHQITRPTTYPVDPLFKEFYESLGGVELLGPAISPLAEFQQWRLQFTVAALLVYDTQAPSRNRFQLGPLGLELGIREPASPPPQEELDNHVDGYVIYERFMPLYRQLSGPRYVGRPLTNLRYNPEKSRLEQYFENLGFYIEDGSADHVQLMAYGAFRCDAHCRYPVHFEASPEIAPQIEDPQARHFYQAVERLEARFTGRPLQAPRQAPDGALEMIYDNLVLYLEPDNPTRVHARPLFQLLGMQAHPPVPRVDDPRLTFFPVQGDLGYNVANLFVDYIARHGGLDIAGRPQTEIFKHREGVFRQCFANLCLDFLAEETDPAWQVRPASLGIAYRAQVNGQLAQESFSDSESLQDLTLMVWETHSLISKDQSQEIFVGLFEGIQPLAGRVPKLTIFYPKNNKIEDYFPPTDNQGISQLIVPPIDASNGTIIPYQVCIQELSQNKNCVKESYVIWSIR